jgi:hypothetical protein
LIVLKLMWSKVKIVLCNSTVWALLTLSFTIFMNSGYMWNQIRGAPYSGMGRNGKVEVIHGSFSSQYQIETQVMSALCKSANTRAFVHILVNRNKDIVTNVNCSLIFCLFIFYIFYIIIIASYVVIYAVLIPIQILIHLCINLK